MDVFLRILALGITGAALTLIIGKQGKEMSVALSIACGVGALLLAFSLLEPVIDLTVRLRVLGNLNKEYVKILFKAAGMCLLLEFACGVCEDAGQSALGKTLRICGNACLVYLAIPLLEDVMELLQELLGGAV